MFLFLVETRLCKSDKGDTYVLSGFTLCRNKFQNFNIGTCYGAAVYIKKMQVQY